MSDIATIVGLFIAGAGWKMSGLRIGPLRAVSLALKSKLIRGPNGGAKSIRVSQIGDLNLLLNNVTKDFYIVVKGPTGVGKSTMIDTCLKGKYGVVRVTIPTGTKEADVVSICQTEIIGGAGWKVMNQPANINRVLFWYHLFFRGQFPIVVITMSVRALGRQPAELTGAVRRLSRLGINVVVDATPNSLQPDLLTTTRQHVLYVEELSRDEIRSLPQLHQLFALLDEERLSDVLLDLLGGIPSLYLNLDSELKRRGETVRDAVTKFLLGLLYSVATEAVSLLTNIPKFKEVLTLLKDCDQIHVTELASRGLKLPSPCRILRQSNLGLTSPVVQPTSPMVALYCKHDSSFEKAREAVLQLIKTARD